MRHILITISILLFSSLVFSSEKKLGNITYSNGANYKGELKDRIPNGIGFLSLPDGGKFVGEFKEGIINGQGTVTLSDGRKYSGEFKDGKKHGQGIYTYPTGEKYLGEFNEGIKHGQGTWTFSDGRKFVGEFKDDQMWNGTEFNKNLETLEKMVNGVKEVEKKTVGVLFHREVNGELGWYKNSEDVNDRKYEGEILNGTPNGKGTLTWSDGSKYVGEFMQGKEHGQGIYTYPNGSKYEGQWKAGKKNGQGTLTHGKGKFVGEFKDDQMWNGTPFSKNGEIIGKMVYGTEIDKNGVIVGKMKIVKGVVQKLEAGGRSEERGMVEVRSDFFNGLGFLNLPDGGKYVGEFRKGFFHGHGTWTFMDGSKWDGEFRENEPWNVLWYDKDGKILGIWANGEKTTQGMAAEMLAKAEGQIEKNLKGYGEIQTSEPNKERGICENIVNEDGALEFKFNNNLHSSLPNEWVEQFKIIMVNLDKVIPVKATSYFCSLDIYAWTDTTDKPFKDKIGNTGGSSISGNPSLNEGGRFMVLEMSSSGFTNNSTHRYSVIPHEYFHVYQLSLSENFYDGKFDIKWLNEGAAASFESLYIRQYYNKNYFNEGQKYVSKAVINNPKIFESYKNSEDEDRNYSSSVFMVLALVNELKKLNHTEESAFKLIYNDFWRMNPSEDNWKTVFQKVFNINLENFYQNLSSYTNWLGSLNIGTVLPSGSIKLENIFSN